MMASNLLPHVLKTMDMNHLYDEFINATIWLTNCWSIKISM